MGVAGAPMCCAIGIQTVLGAGILTAGISAVFFLWGTFALPNLKMGILISIPPF
jgi:hypothetical protein